MTLAPENELLLVEREVAQLFRVSAATVRRWRRLNLGPRWIYVGPNSIRYQLDDLISFLESRRSAGHLQCSENDGIQPRSVAPC